MKKVMLLIAVVISITNISTAQRGFSIGLKAGANYANVYDSQDNDFQADSKLGFVGGLTLAIPFGKFLGFQPELLYSQKGFKGTGKLLGTSYGLTRTSNYIDIPLMLAIKPIEFITIYAGPQYSYLMKQKDEFQGGALTVDQEREFNKQDIRKNTLGFIGGLDFNLKNAVVGVRAGWDMQNNNGDGTSTTPRYKNAWLQGTLGIRIY